MLQKIQSFLKSKNFGYLSSILLSILVIVFLQLFYIEQKFYFVLNQTTYISVHSLLEMYSIVTSFSIFGVSWVSYKMSKNKHTLFLSFSFLVVGTLDLIHTLTFPPMPTFFTDNSINKTIHVWLITRAFSAVTLAISAFINPASKSALLKKKALLFYTTIIILFTLVSVFFYLNKMPVMYIDGKGLTPIKKYIEYGIISIFAFAAVSYWARFSKSKEIYYQSLIIGLIFTAFSELFLTIYKNAYDVFNITGHLYKTIAFLFIYNALFKASVEKPYAEVEREKEKNDITIKGAELGTWEWKVQTGEIEFNEKWATILGYKLSELQPVSIKTWENLLFEEDVKEAYKALDEHFQGKKPLYSFEARMKHKNGSTVWVETRGKVVEWDEKGNPLTMVGIHVDITKLKTTEEQVMELNKRNIAVLQSIGDAVIAIGSNENILIFNKTAEIITGYKEKDVIGKNYRSVLKFINDITEHAEFKFIEDSLKKNVKSYTPDNTIIIKSDGTRLPIKDSAAPITDGKGNVIGCVVIFRDTTEEQRIEAAKSELISLTSHQLRTPLTALKWISELLDSERHGKLSKEQKQFTKQIQEASCRMIDLVNATLNVSRLEMGTFIIEPVEVDLKKFSQKYIKDLMPQIEHKKIKFKEHYDKNLPNVLLDENLIGMVISNLLTNAVKYTPKNERVYFGIGADKNGILIIVSDTGIGISKENQNKIFDRLFRADNAKKMDTNGTGLGLYIIKKIADLTGCRVEFSSEEGTGSEFIFKIPLEGMKKKKGTKKLTL